MTISKGNKRYEVVLQPVSGRALPVYCVEVLRISLLEDTQCVDFNCFNLHDYKNICPLDIPGPLDFVKKGDVLLSNPNRYNPMLAIVEMPDNYVTDLLGARCSATLFERKHKFDSHTNCQDTFAQCIGEYGLAPDDVYDSFNI